MAWYDINYNCGHTGREQIYGKINGREGRATWIGQHKSCPDCYQAQILADRQAKDEAAKKAAEEQGLPALVGSDKQIVWAETIRQEKIARINKLIRVIEIMHNPGGSIVREGLVQIIADYDQYLLRYCRDNYQAVIDYCLIKLSNYKKWTEAKKFINCRNEEELEDLVDAVN